MEKKHAAQDRKPGFSRSRYKGAWRAGYFAALGFKVGQGRCRCYASRPALSFGMY